MGAWKAKGADRVRGRRRAEVVRLLAGRRGKPRRAGAVRQAHDAGVLSGSKGARGASDGPGAGPDGDRALARRLGRIRRALYDLYGDLEYFESSPLEHRERLRQGLDWPDVGHITSLLRSLSEEKRFTEWLGLNAFARKKTA